MQGVSSGTLRQQPPPAVPVQCWWQHQLLSAAASAAVGQICCCSSPLQLCVLLVAAKGVAEQQQASEVTTGPHSSAQSGGACNTLASTQALDSPKQLCSSFQWFPAGGEAECVAFWPLASTRMSAVDGSPAHTHLHVSSGHS